MFGADLRYFLVIFECLWFFFFFFALPQGWGAKLALHKSKPFTLRQAIAMICSAEEHALLQGWGAKIYSAAEHVFLQGYGCNCCSAEEPFLNNCLKDKPDPGDHSVSIPFKRHQAVKDSVPWRECWKHHHGHCVGSWLHLAVFSVHLSGQPEPHINYKLSRHICPSSGRMQGECCKDLENVDRFALQNSMPLFRGDLIWRRCRLRRFFKARR